MWKKNKYTVGGNIMNIPNMKNNMEFPQKLKIELLDLREATAQRQSTHEWCARSYVALIPRTEKNWAAYPKENDISTQAASCSMFTAAFFIIGQIQSQCLCLLLNE